ncbi:MAG: polysaccharide biosynthesis/export family protein [Phascolarctobacterium sp.]|nr:polysaccharide biosynthesis/export family protein [Phascolarctobacterium sp.]
MKRLLFSALLAGSLMLPLAGTQAAEPAEYVMCGGDQLQLTVYNHPDLSSPITSNANPYIVRPDGRLSMPLIGDVDVTGKTVSQVQKEITDRLSEYIVDPMVTINITKLGTTRVYVLGEVKRQGMYELEKSHNLLDALAKAEGFTEASAKKKVFVIRRGEKDAFMKVNINALLTKGDTSKNITLQEGDCVYLSSNGKIIFQKDILPFLNAWYMGSEIRQNNKD